MNYAKITTCDIANGPGIGVVLWCQGCNLHCKNCHNQETWDFDGGKPFTKEEEAALLKELGKPYVSRLTISGGHPLEEKNLQAVGDLCVKVKEEYPEIKIWIYTGYLWEYVQNWYLMRYVDVIVDGTYQEDKRDITLKFRGSSNQRIIDVQKSLKKGEAVLYDI